MTWRWLCSHADTYRERRDIGAARGVLHLVCPRCGHAEPAVSRTTAEHIRIRRGERLAS